MDAAMPYGELVHTADAVASTAARSEKVRLLAGLLRGVSAPTEAEVVVGFLVGRPRQGRLGVGWATVRDAQSLAHSGRSDRARASVLDVDTALGELAAATGPGSQRARVDALAGLLGRLDDAERDHLVRLLHGEMRQGALDGVVTDAVAVAGERPAAKVRRAAMLLGGLGPAAARALTGGSLDVALAPLTGVQPMLAAASASVSEALAATGPASVEWKLDGARVQVHRRGDDVRVFTRSLHEIAARVPQIVEAALVVPAAEFVLDGEALGLDADGAPLAFQDSMHAATPLRPFFFDVLHAEGRSLVDTPLGDRAAILRDLVPASMRLTAVQTADPDVAERVAAGALRAGHEGVMVKALDAPYEAGRRGASWRKVKPVHTLDLVVLAAEWGHGRRRGWLSNLHLGARDASSPGTFVMVGKTFKGLTDELLAWQTEALQRVAIGPAEDGYVQHVRPELVVEIAVDGVQRSTRYPGGVALRFARVRRYRTDKPAGEADTIERVQSMLPGATGPAR